MRGPRSSPADALRRGALAIPPNRRDACFPSLACEFKPHVQPTRHAVLRSSAETRPRLGERADPRDLAGRARRARTRTRRSAGAADRDLRDPAGHQPVTDRRAAGVPTDRRHRCAASALRHGVRAASRRRRLCSHGRRDARGPDGGPRSRAHPDRSERQLSFARFPRQDDAAPAGLVADRPARTRTPHPREVRRQLGAVPAAAAR